VPGIVVVFIQVGRVWLIPAAVLAGLAAVTAANWSRPEGVGGRARQVTLLRFAAITTAKRVGLEVLPGLACGVLPARLARVPPTYRQRPGRRVLTRLVTRGLSMGGILGRVRLLTARRLILITVARPLVLVSGPRREALVAARRRITVTIAGPGPVVAARRRITVTIAGRSPVVAARRRITVTIAGPGLLVTARRHIAVTASRRGLLITARRHIQVASIRRRVLVTTWWRITVTIARDPVAPVGREALVAVRRPSRVIRTRRRILVTTARDVPRHAGLRNIFELTLRLRVVAARPPGK
jgi:hypothetical protein